MSDFQKVIEDWCFALNNSERTVYPPLVVKMTALKWRNCGVENLSDTIPDNEIVCAQIDPANIKTRIENDSFFIDLYFEQL